MIYVISKSTFGEYGVRDIQCNANWDCCPYSDYALIPEDLVDGILATQGYCDIVLSIDGTIVQSFIARSIPSVPEECHGVNTVLSVNGVRANTGGEVNLKPADVGAAPAGYGLGEQTPQVVDANSAKTNGFYKVSGANSPFGAASSALVLSYDNYVYNQVIVHGELMALRESQDGFYEEWNYINPPMVVGVEYRTIERWQGKPVYAKLIDCGALPANSTKTVTSVIASSHEVCEMRCIATKVNANGAMFTLPILGETGSILARAGIINGGHLYIVTFTDMSTYNLKVLLKYVKS